MHESSPLIHNQWHIVTRLHDWMIANCFIVIFFRKMWKCEKLNQIKQINFFDSLFWSLFLPLVFQTHPMNNAPIICNTGISRGKLNGATMATGPYGQRKLGVLISITNNKQSIGICIRAMFVCRFLPVGNLTRSVAGDWKTARQKAHLIAAKVVQKRARHAHFAERLFKRLS